jgi:hypothetical protein
MFSHNTVVNYYKTNFALMQHHKYSLVDIETMMPWERYVYIDLLSEFIKKQEQDRRDREAAMRAKRRK